MVLVFLRTIKIGTSNDWQLRAWGRDATMFRQPLMCISILHRRSCKPSIFSNISAIWSHREYFLISGKILISITHTVWSVLSENDNKWSPCLLISRESKETRILKSFYFGQAMVQAHNRHIRRLKLYRSFNGDAFWRESINLHLNLFWRRKMAGCKKKSLNFCLSSLEFIG